MKIKAAIEKNRPFCACLESMWSDMIGLGNRFGHVDYVRHRLTGAALWVKSRSREEEELYFLRNMLQDQREIYEVKQEAA